MILAFSLAAIGHTLSIHIDFNWFGKAVFVISSMNPVKSPSPFPAFSVLYRKIDWRAIGTGGLSMNPKNRCICPAA
uniref:hypothetical protein n=1 Tax=Candidatus Fimivicinus sp. TaxID=3056640 RepID=UPI003FEF56EA